MRLSYFSLLAVLFFAGIQAIENHESKEVHAGFCPIHRFICMIVCSPETSAKMCENSSNCCTSDSQCASDEKCCQPACGCYNQCTKAQAKLEFSD